MGRGVGFLGFGFFFLTSDLLPDYELKAHSRELQHL